MSMITVFVHSPAGFACEPAVSDLVPGEAARHSPATLQETPIGADGTIPEDARAQADLCISNIAAILAEAGMTLSDIVRLNAYVTDRAHMKGYMESRDAHVATPPPASTLMIVSGFTLPAFKVEIEVLAAAL